ncbi:uridine kinase [Pokkaliibacter plantistimulans]|uniref:Uridine kinase n=2 Tax=Pseudomonadota TaxID=1224 RepID=A0ABX5LW07_9GAMM|nr:MULTISPECIES: uridine kinase [Pokkaliibacter]MDH2436477.1 uridine kinase [Pokkaliibacter sp. MBI-7]PPC77337.1 uridine kinase [Pokkaliibacter plantistimulans]PXF30804.1 uridine kinase [Pokkaliibacter plantistimulans]
MPTSNTVIIGIAGASGSGKSSFSDALLHEFGSAQITILREDSYYKDQTHLAMEERVKTNYDHPDAFDHDLLLTQLQQALQGEPVNVPVYDYKLHTRAAEVQPLPACKIIILEGILIFTDARLRNLMHTRIYMDTPLDVCLLRRLQRDVNERGRTLDSVLEQYQATVRPMFMKYINPSKEHAHLIVPGGARNRVAIDLVRARLREML